MMTREEKLASGEPCCVACGDAPARWDEARGMRGAYVCRACTCRDGKPPPFGSPWYEPVRVAPLVWKPEAEALARQGTLPNSIPGEALCELDAWRAKSLADAERVDDLLKELGEARGRIDELQAVAASLRASLDPTDVGLFPGLSHAETGRALARMLRDADAARARVVAELDHHRDGEHDRRRHNDCPVCIRETVETIVRDLRGQADVADKAAAIYEDVEARFEQQKLPAGGWMRGAPPLGHPIEGLPDGYGSADWTRRHAMSLRNAAERIEQRWGRR